MKFASLLLIYMKFIEVIVCQNGIKFPQEDIRESAGGIQRLIVEVLLEAFSYRDKCITIVTDDVYYDVFHHNFFRKFEKDISFFMVMIEDSEDLLSPYNRTQEVLTAAKAEGCEFYVILIANGLQVARLLRFGDRYRELDTRAKFIILYDYRLFQKELHYLWKRIVNVIFIREFSGVKKHTSGAKLAPWFEITTVPFPAPIKTFLVPRRLDIWRESKFRSGTDLFRDKTSDLRNQTLKVVTFGHIPATTKIPIPEYKTVRTVVATGNGSLGFAGIEIEILETISKTMNFQALIYEPENGDVEMWGRKSPTATTGLLGEMEKSNADIALGDLYYSTYYLRFMDLSVPYHTECLTFLTPESLTDNSWKTLILPFTPIMWAAVLICLFAIGFIFNALARFYYHIHQIQQSNSKNRIIPSKKKGVLTLSLHPIATKLDSNLKYTLMKQKLVPPKIEGEPEGLYLFGELLNSILYTYSMHLMVSLPKLPTGWALRVLTGWYWLYCTLIVVAYRASMTAILANPAPRVTIDTVQELADSKISCGGWGEINHEFFKTSLDPTSQVIGSRFEMVNDSDVAVDYVAEGSFAFYENIHFLKQASVKRQLRLRFAKSNETAGEKKGDHNLHIMSDCVINMPIAIGLQKNSPIQPRVNKFIVRVFEAGLIKKWLDDVMQDALKFELYKSDDSVKALMDLQKFSGAIVALFIGYFVSICALSAEMLYFYYAVERHPDFDKYSKQIIKIK